MSNLKIIIYIVYHVNQFIDRPSSNKIEEDEPFFSKVFYYYPLKYGIKYVFLYKEIIKLE